MAFDWCLGLPDKPTILSDGRCSSGDHGDGMASSPLIAIGRGGVQLRAGRRCDPSCFSEPRSNSPISIVGEGGSGQLSLGERHRLILTVREDEASVYLNTSRIIHSTGIVRILLQLLVLRSAFGAAYA